MSHQDSMDIVQVFNFFLLAGAVHGFIFNLVTFLARKSIEPAVLYLNLFVFFISLNNIQSWILDKGFIEANSIFYFATVPWYVFIVPMFYAFLVYYLELEKKKWPFIRITLALFFIELFMRIGLLYGVNAGNWPMSLLSGYNVLEDAITLSYSLLLYYKSLRILYAHEDLYRPILAFDNLRWVKRFLKIGGVVIFLWFLAIMLNVLSPQIQPPYNYYPLRLGSTILIYWVGYQAFFHYVILKDRIKLRARITNKTTPLNHNSAPALSIPYRSNKDSNKDKEIFREVNHYVHTNQSYLDPLLSLESLSEELETGQSTLSRMINQQSGKNFSDYINELRVEEAKKLLADTEFNAYTIVAIGLECGFNSRSTFYSAFNKFTGMTPTAYRAHNTHL